MERISCPVYHGTSAYPMNLLKDAMDNVSTSQRWPGISEGQCLGVILPKSVGSGTSAVMTSWKYGSPVSEIKPI